MRVAIDLTALNAKPSGIDRYLVGMVRSLAKFGSAADFFLFINFEDRARFSPPDELPENFRVLPICLRPRLIRLIFQQVLLPLLLNLMRIDVLHSPTFIMPAWRGRARHVLTIHDMSSFMFPQFHPSVRRGPLYESVVRGSIRRADVVSVPSRSVKTDIARLVPKVDPTRVRVIPCGINEVFRPRTEPELAPTLRRLGLVRPYLLYLGTLDPRKNLPRLIEAFSLLNEQRYRLVLGGASGWAPNESLTKAGRVQWLGYVAEIDLPFVYAGAALFVYPSFLEGFGFPPLEAMACGVPVIAANNSSLRENLAGAALLVQPDDSREIAAAMKTLLTDETARARAIAAGLKQVESFRWDRFAEQTFACYEDGS